jgi:hypothetical protein
MRAEKLWLISSEKQVAGNKFHTQWLVRYEILGRWLSVAPSHLGFLVSVPM